MSEFFQSLVDEMKDEDVSILSDGKSSAEFTGYIDTGSYVFNAVLSGSIYNGIPNNKVVGLVGETSTGKCVAKDTPISVYFNKEEGQEDYYRVVMGLSNSVLGYSAKDNKHIVTTTYGDFYNLYGNGDHENPCAVTDNAFILTPEGYAPIHEVVAKDNQQMLKIGFDNGQSIECSEEHLFSYKGESVLAKDAVEVDTRYGTTKITSKVLGDIETAYDIGIDAPHWYISSNECEVIHHNTFIALGVVRYFLETHPDAGVVYFDTESAVTKQMMVERNIDPKRVMIAEPETIEDFQHKATVIINAYMAKNKKDRPPLMFVLDSLGMLSSKKELEGAETGNQKADMGRSQKLLKAAFRTLTAKLAKAGIPMIVTGHVYADMGSMYPTNKVAGGCLVAGTQVMTREGFVNIENFKGGEFVMTKEGDWKEVLETHHFEDKDLLTIEFENGYAVTCTKNHKFFINDGWVCAEGIVTGDDCSVLDNEEFSASLKVKSVTPAGKGEVFDISVEQHENYILQHGVVSHNSGMKYAASIIAMLGKSQDKDQKTKTLNGIFVRMKMFKSRFTKEGSEVKGNVNFMKGLDRYYGLVDLALEAGVWEKKGTQIVVCDGSKRFAKFINANPEKFYTKEVLDRIDEYTKQRFGYGRLAFDDVGEVGDELEDEANTEDSNTEASDGEETAA